MKQIASIKSQIAENKIDQALASLNNIIKTESDSFNNYIILKNNYLQYKSNKFQGLDTVEHLDIAFQKLIVKFLQLLDSLSNKDILDSKDVPSSKNRDEIRYEKILVVCPPERKQAMEKFFSRYYFQNLNFETSQSIPKNIEDYLVIIFDYQSPVEYSKDLLEQYLIQSNPYLIFFGEKFPFYPKYKERVYFANSMFSLYARIKEMLDFLKYINPK